MHISKRQFFTRLSRNTKNSKKMVAEALEEHEEVKMLLAEIEDLELRKP